MSLPSPLPEAGLTESVLHAIEHLVVGCGGFARELIAFTAGTSDLKDDTGQRLSAADVLLDQLIRERLTALVPGSCGYSEEGGAFGDPRSGPQVRWLIDPIDGTRPATLGGAFAISVGGLVFREGKPVAAAGWVYVPTSSTLYRGIVAPSFADCRLNGRVAHAPEAPAEATLPRHFLAVSSDWHRVAADDCPLKLTAPGATAVHLAHLVHPNSDLVATALTRYRSYDAAGGLVIAAAGGCEIYPLPTVGWRPHAKPVEPLVFLEELDRHPAIYAPRVLVARPEVASLLQGCRSPLHG